MSSESSSRRSASSSVGFALTSALVSALVFLGTGCLKAHIFLTNDGGSGGTGGSVTGIGGGLGGDNSGVGGDEGLGGDTGGGEGGAGEGGAGGAGTGGTMGTGGVPDAGYDGPIAPAPDMPGQLVITEIMADTNAVSDESGEWFEVYNATASDTFDVYGCLLSDSGNTNQITAHLLIGPGEFLTFARFATAAVGGFTPSFNYHTTRDANGLLDPTKDVKFSNSGDLARITCGANILIDVAAFTVVPNGRSLSLDPSHFSATDNDMPENWCPSPASAYHTVSASDYGTPGMTNPPCPRG